MLWLKENLLWRKIQEGVWRSRRYAKVIKRRWLWDAHRLLGGEIQHQEFVDGERFKWWAYEVHFVKMVGAVENEFKEGYESTLQEAINKVEEAVGVTEKQY